MFYDIRFNAVAPVDGKLIRLIINIEAQNDFHPGYPLLKRAMFYGCRMISSQYGTVFVRSEYGKIEKVYTIWVCMEPTEKWAYTITRYHMAEENIIGNAKAPKADYDLITPVLVCLGEKKYTELQGVLRMLNLLFVDNVSKDEKIKTLRQDFGIQTTPKLEKGVAEMCNLSDGIERRGEKRGREKERISLLREMIGLGKLTIAEAAKMANMSVEKFRKLAML